MSDEILLGVSACRVCPSVPDPVPKVGVTVFPYPIAFVQAPADFIPDIRRKRIDSCIPASNGVCNFCITLCVHICGSGNVAAFINRGIAISPNIGWDVQVKIPGIRCAVTRWVAVLGKTRCGE